VRHCTGRKLAVTVAATLVTLAGYALLIPLWGVMGAALATLAGFAFLAAATYVVTQRIFYVEYEWSRLSGLCLLAGALWLMGTWLPNGAWGMAGKGALLASAPVLAWLGGLSSAEDRRTVRAVLQGLERLRGQRVVSLPERSA
jgi:O-antigen/teichoic acid export membrane protein